MNAQTNSVPAGNSQPDWTSSQLFVDDRWIAASIRLQRVFHQPEKWPKPVIRPDRPWEGERIHAYGTALWRDGRFHLWYAAGGRICYATSADGLHFEKPGLGLIPWKGSTDNNICLVPGMPASADGPVAPQPETVYDEDIARARLDGIGVIEDPEDSEWPLKAIFWQNPPGGHGLWAVRSRDGIHWDYRPGLVLPGWHDRTDPVATKIDGKYVMVCRPAEAVAPGRDRYLSRHAYRAESEDLIHWSTPEIIAKQDLDDPPALEVYSAQIFPYESLFLGFAEIMHNVPDRFTAQLMFSPDSHRWQRVRRPAPFLDTGPAGAFDCDHVNVLSNGVIRHKNRLWIYYSGRTGGHSRSPLNTGAIGVAMLRPDGFVSLKATEREGWAATPAVEWGDLELQLNYDPRRDLNADPKHGTGAVRVEIRDPDDNPLPGFSRDECLVPTDRTSRTVNAYADKQYDEAGDDTRPEYLTVRWRHGATARQLAGRRIKLVFYVRDAHLYAFRGCPSE